MVDNINWETMSKTEKKVRRVGAWCSHGKKENTTHYFIAKNTRSRTAISRCGSVITDAGHLKEIVPLKECFVCSLYANTEKKEVQVANENYLSELLPDVSED